MFYLVCFDIVDDRARNKVVKVLKEYGVRVQKSVFECADLTEERFLRMKDRTESLIDHTQDTVRDYALCRDCLKKMEFNGTGELPGVDAYRVI